MGQLYPDDENHLLLNEITRITTQEPGNALNSFISTTPITPLGQKDVNMSIVVHHQPHFTSQNQMKQLFGVISFIQDDVASLWINSILR